MKNHIYRPLFIVVAFVAVILAARALYVPETFGVHEMGYRFGWHDKANEEEWRGFKIKYLQPDFCKECHDQKWETIKGSAHMNISCQNCHAVEGVVAADHPEKVEKMAIDRSRAQCLRCHADIPDVGSGRASITKKVDGSSHPWEEEKETQCVTCHDVHAASFK